ncbi:MAG: peptide chain release factor N(5)-glutamine methyltransferase [Sphingobacteriales bacterium JAD_PAG50586_3]|nr:MAG: peptide chain release factor N(5)-glutamine methyltransferase [Sphingobacteriales bacterium JAD_PAG50586_3]
MQVTVANIINQFHLQLDEVYGSNEVETFARLALEQYDAIPYSDYKSYIDKEIKNDVYTNVLDRLIKREPIQYILGIAWFYDLAFKVNTNVLIPRPETEELVDLIIKENPKAERIIDICTGSGCIAISLKKNLPNATVWATDFIDGALGVAKENARVLQADVTIIKHDALSGDYSTLSVDCDVIVSNPPYVKENEKEGLEPHVLNFEPHTALFVPDDDALLFYRHIGTAALGLLRSGGTLYFECHTDHATEVANLLLALGYKSCKIVKDMFGRERIAQAVKE